MSTNTLTREEKRVRIAEALGWKVSNELEDGALMGHHPVPNSDFLGWDMVPDFFGSLDACHEMEKSLSDDKQRRKYAEDLAYLTNAECMEDPLNVFIAAHAEAWQKAEAFGLALGLWQPGE